MSVKDGGTSPVQPRPLSADTYCDVLGQDVFHSTTVKGHQDYVWRLPATPDVRDAALVFLDWVCMCAVQVRSSSLSPSLRLRPNDSSSVDLQWPDIVRNQSKYQKWDSQTAKSQKSLDTDIDGVQTKNKQIKGNRGPCEVDWIRQVRLKFRHSGVLESGAGLICLYPNPHKDRTTCVSGAFSSHCFPLNVSLSPGVCVSVIVNVSANQKFLRLTTNFSSHNSLCRRSVFVGKLTGWYLWCCRQQVTV